MTMNTAASASNRPRPHSPNRPISITGMRLVGTEPIPGATYRKVFRNGSARTLPVLPSDHYGLLLEMEVIR